MQIHLILLPGEAVRTSVSIIIIMNTLHMTVRVTTAPDVTQSFGAMQDRTGIHLTYCLIVPEWPDRPNDTK